MTLSEWLLVQIAADETAARAAMTRTGSTLFTDAQRGGKQAVLDHIARHDPARVLAQCAAHRRIVEMHAGEQLWCDGGYVEGMTHDEVRHSATLNGEPYGEECPTLRALASIYAGADGWRGEWQ